MKKPLNRIFFLFCVTIAAFVYSSMVFPPDPAYIFELGIPEYI
jgi:hypothetical protein